MHKCMSFCLCMIVRVSFRLCMIVCLFVYVWLYVFSSMYDCMSFRLCMIVCLSDNVWLYVFPSMYDCMSFRQCMIVYVSKFLSPLPSNSYQITLNLWLLPHPSSPPPPHSHSPPSLCSPLFLYTNESFHFCVVFNSLLASLVSNVDVRSKKNKVFTWMLKCTGLTLSLFLHLFPSVGQISTSETQFWKHFRAITVQWRTIPVSLSLH